MRMGARSDVPIEFGGHEGLSVYEEELTAARRRELLVGEGSGQGDEDVGTVTSVVEVGNSDLRGGGVSVANKTDTWTDHCGITVLKRDADAADRAAKLVLRCVQQTAGAGEGDGSGEGELAGGVGGGGLGEGHAGRAGDGCRAGRSDGGESSAQGSDVGAVERSDLSTNNLNLLSIRT